MKNLISKLKIKQKIFLVILIPIISLIVVTIYNIYDKKESIKKLEYFHTHYEYYEKVTNLIHLIEDERKLAFFYIGSNGRNYKHELEKQRLIIDKSFEKLDLFLKIHHDIFDKKLKKLIDDNIDHLELFRFDVDNLKLFLDIEKNFYTDLIYNLLYSASNIPAMTNNRYLSNQTLAYKHLIEAKEYLSLREGLLNYIAASNTLTVKDIHKLKFLEAFYKDNLNMFKYFVSANIKKELLDAKLSQYGSSTKVHNRLKKQFVNIQKVQKVKDVERLKVDISKINLKELSFAVSKKALILKDIENSLAKDILKTIRFEKNKLYTRLNIYMFTIFFILLLVFATGYLISKNIIEKIVKLENGLVGFLKYVKKEEKRFKPLAVKGNDEIDHMAEIVNESIKETAIFIEQEIKNGKRLHTQMMEAEKLAQMGEMIGNIAHQWRQPLSMISTVASGISIKKSYSLEISDSELIEQMEKIDEYSQYLSETIDTFRNFIKEDKELKSQSIQENIKQAKDIIGAVLIDSGVELIDNIDYTNKIYLNMVTGELPQVIINILNNAKDIILLKKIEDGWVKIQMEVVDERAIISIEDNGGGVPDDIKGKIFDPYFTTKHQSQGTGLGLHMSYRIITESLNGKIYVENTNDGAKFYVEIPLIR